MNRQNWRGVVFLLVGFVLLANPLYLYPDGVYYEIRETGKERYPTGWGWKAPSRITIDAMRLAAWIGGVALVWRAGEWTERGR